MSITAMKQALEALEDIFGKNKVDVGVINSLRQAIAETEKQEPVAVWELQECGWETICDPDWLMTLPIGTLLYTHPPKREAEKQEPVAWYVWFGSEDDPNYVCTGDKPDEPDATIRPLVFGDTHPPKREWVGLTDKELEEFSDAKLGSYDLCLEVEAKLKEKNT